MDLTTPTSRVKSFIKPERIPSTQIYPWLVIPVMACLIVLYILANFVFPGRLPPLVNVVIAQPALWLLLAILAYVAWRHGVKYPPVLNKMLIVTAIVTGLFQVAIFIIAGLFSGFGHSNVAHSFWPMMGNVLYFVSVLLGMEMSRACVTGILKNRSGILALIVATLLFSLAMTPFGRYTSISSIPDGFETAGQFFLPTLSENLLASYLALVGGPLPAIAYRIILEVFLWLSPIQPDLDWMIIAFLGTITPALGLGIIQSQIAETPEVKTNEQKHAEQRSSLGWVITGTLVVALVWFNAGLFGIQPSLVSGPSMNPTLLVGDVVVTQNVPPEKIQIGDIVRFRDEDIYIIHRVVEVEQLESGDYIFTTKGDNNNVADAPIVEDQLAGKVILTIPKIGWVSIFIRQLIGRGP